MSQYQPYNLPQPQAIYIGQNLHAQPGYLQTVQQGYLTPTLQQVQQQQGYLPPNSNSITYAQGSVSYLPQEQEPVSCGTFPGSANLQYQSHSLKEKKSTLSANATEYVQNTPPASFVQSAGQHEQNTQEYQTQSPYSQGEKKYIARQQDQYPSGQKHYASGQGHYPSGQGHYPSGQGQCSSGQVQYTGQGQYLSSGQGQYSSGQGQYSSGQDQFPLGQIQYSAGNEDKSLRQAQVQFDQGHPSSQVCAPEQYSSVSGQYSSVSGQFSSAQGQYSSAQGQYSSVQGHNWADPPKRYSSDPKQQGRPLQRDQEHIQKGPSDFFQQDHKKTSQRQKEPYPHKQKGQPFMKRDTMHDRRDIKSVPDQDKYQSHSKDIEKNTSTYQNSEHNDTPHSSIERSNRNDLPGTVKQSPLSDFGDMGAAVQKYAQLVPKKSTFMDPAQYDRARTDDNNYRKEHNLVVWDERGKAPVPNPIEHFEDIPGLKEVQIKAFYEAGFQSPTPIQAQTWPVALKDRDVVSIAKTGSGKTLAFLLPAYQKIGAKSSRQKKSIYALILSPTRELALQIQDEADRFGSIAGCRAACVYGGAPKRDQLQKINGGISVLIATPGRLNDFLDSRQIDLSTVFYLVMDEADRMLDMGFEPQIRTILKHLPRKRQTLMFSATWPEEVRRLANDFIFSPIHIRLGDQDELQANENIRQHLVLLRSGEDKDREVVNLLKSKICNSGDNILLFVARKNTCNFVANMLNRVGIRSAAMHGDRTQDFREETLARFKNGNLPVLVATDVASRGLDVKGLSAVVNYDMPGSTEDYVHRIGRTGRAGLNGESYTFLTHSGEDIWKVQSIVEVMEKTGQTVPNEVQVLIDELKEKQKRNSERRAAEDEQFSKVLIVAEKPSVAKMIADSLSVNGRYRTRKGKSRANQIFEIIKWFPPAQQKCKLMITSVVGHIFGLTFENQRVQDIATLFDAPVKKVVEDTSKKLCIVDHLQELASESQYLYLWLDCDREGENIGFEVVSLSEEWIHYDNVYRARFSSLTKTELNYAYENPIRPDKYAAMSVDARQELDLKIGVAFTRLMTRTYLDQARIKFRLKDQKCISYGPCQTPTLWFCAQRHKEIQSFQRDKYFVFSIPVNLFGQDCLFTYVDEKVFDQQQAQKLESVIEANQNVMVQEVKEEKKVYHKPNGLNTVTLLKACSKGLGMSPSAAMNAAEHLYTAGFISYPRTETTSYSPSFDLVSVLREQANNPNWGRAASYLLNEGRVSPPGRGHDAGDHPPITPMKAANRSDMKPNEWRIYDFITRYFIASLHNNFEYVEYTIKVVIGDFLFCYKCHKVLDRGFTFAMPWKEKDLKLNETSFHPDQSLHGQSFSKKKLQKQEEYTKPPDYLQESELITLMDKNGIGTDASIPQHIKNIQDRHYVDVCGPGDNGQKGAVIPVRKFFGKNNRGRGGQQAPPPSSRHMVPRGFGLAFLSCFENLDYELCEPTIRGYMEQQINKIATGETEKSEVVSSNLKLFQNKFVDFRQNLSRCDRYFAPKDFADSSGRNDFESNRSNHNFYNTNNNNNNRSNNNINNGGFSGSNEASFVGNFNNGDFRGRGGFNDSRGRGRGNRGRGSQNIRGKRGDHSFGHAGNFKRQKTWE